METIQYIERDGKPEYAVLPIELWKRIAPLIGAYGEPDEPDGTPPLPPPVAQAVRNGAHPLRAWREYRKLTQEQLAATAHISKPFLSQLENGKRRATITVLAALAQALAVPIDALMPS